MIYVSSKFELAVFSGSIQSNLTVRCEREVEAVVGLKSWFIDQQGAGQA